MAKRLRKDISETEWLFDRVDKQPNGCWRWTGEQLKSGYGRVRLRHDSARSTTAHRFAYTILCGPIPAGLVIDHLCRNRYCVNPDHLEAVTPAVNNQRSAKYAHRYHRGITHCPQGHPYSAENTYINAATGSRHCRICSNAHKAAWRERNRHQIKAVAVQPLDRPVCD